MSIFGVKKRKTEENELTLRVDDLHRRVRPLMNIERRFSEFQQEVHNTRGVMLRQINTYNDRHKTLQDRVKEMEIKQGLTTSKLENQKYFITITAESKGTLTSGEIFSFGNGGKTADTGYVMMKSGRVIGIGFVSDRSRGKANAQVLVNSKGLKGSVIELDDGIKSNFKLYDNPFDVSAGDVITFVAGTTNGTTINTVVSLLIELEN